MKLLAWLLAAAVWLGMAATAQASPVLAKDKKCFVCHKVDRPGLGPSFHDVARRYRGQAGAQEALANKVLKGGGGAWKGPMPSMPANTQVSPAEARQLLRWILSLK